MTNEQLKILLESQALLLKEAIEKAVELMPKNSERELEWFYKGKGSETASTFQIMAAAGGSRENSPDWEQRPTENTLR